ncbi:hypothetical protein HB912_00335 [Listeria aquatica]|uniref:Bacterial Ig domain-containing protein n=1 Tax=Listeria aquatica TaxID=1494960 RepID=A0A841ZM61_9LIST|nr:immunoglobulin-like domain-containing protein [Listeria aquatica]MBC1520090.1 hypothetical protein [Listeria aquatica]
MNKNLKRFFTLSAILGVTVSTIVPNTAAATANTAEQKINSNKTTVQKAKTSKQSKQENTNINEKLLNSASISIIGDAELATNGLKVDEHGNSTGHLILRYAFKQGASVDVASDYRFSFYLPAEFREIAKTPEFFAAIEKAEVYNTSWHVGSPAVPIPRDHISYNEEANTFRFDLDDYTATAANFLPTNEITVDINLGKAVTESHIRIPRASTGKYHFGGEAWKSTLGLLDYRYVQNSGANTYLTLPQGIDPGYGKDWDYGEDGNGENENTKPTITANSLNFEKGQNVAEGDLTAGAVAADKEDGIIDSSKIYVKSYNGFTTATPGTYHVTLAVKDSQGAEGTYERTVVVKDSDSNNDSGEEAGTLNPNVYTIGEGYVKGMYSGDIKTVALEVNGAVQKKVNVVDNANFQYYAKNFITSQNDQVYVRGYGKDGKQLAREKVEVVKNESGVATPAKYALGATNVTGSVSGDVKKVALEVNGHKYSPVKTISATAFQYYAKDKITSLTDEVYVIGYANDGKQLSRKPVTITNSTVQGSITANTMKVGSDAYVTGTHSSNITKVALQVGSKVYPKVAVTSGSDYQYYAKDKVNSTDQTVKIIGYGAGSTKIAEKIVNLSDQTLGNGSLSPARYTIGSSNVKGTYTGSIKYVALKVNGTTYDKVGVVNSTDFQYYAKDKITSTGDTVSVIGYDSHGKIAEQPVQIGDSSTAEQGTITANKYTLGTANITGTHSSEVKYVRLVVDGKKYDSVPVISATDFRYYAKDKVTNKNQSVRIEGLASNNTTVIAHDDIIFN